MNMISQVAFGVGVVVLGVLMLFTMIYNMGKYPSNLMAVEESHWYDETTDSVLTVSYNEFTLVSVKENVTIEGIVTDSELISDVGSIKYSISDGICQFEYQTIKYSLHYFDNERTNILKDFESRLVEQKKSE